MPDRFARASVEEQLKAVLASRFFEKKANAAVLLQFLVRKELDNPGRSSNRREVVDSCFPGRSDEQIASTEKRRLRLYLSEYYAGEGLNAPFRFALCEQSGFRVAIEPRPLEDRNDFVGREAELAAMAQAFAAAAAGSFSLLLVEGAAGFGKTAVLEMHAAHCCRQNNVARIGTAVAHDAGIAVQSYQPLEEALESLCAPALGAHTSEIRSQLQKRAPAWAARIEGRTFGGGAASRLQLISFLAAISVERPTLLVLDDVHLADASLLTYLHGVIQASPPRVQIVLTYRPEAMRDRASQILKLTGHRCVVQVPLAPLRRADITAYLNRRFNPNLFPSDLTEVLFELTGGCPLFLKRITERLYSMASIVKDGDKRENFWQLTCPVLQVADSVPKELESVIDVAFADLAIDEQEVLCAAALQGEEFESASVSRVIGEDASAIEARLRAIANKSDLIYFKRSSSVPGSEPSARYRFRHSLYQRGALRALEGEPTTRARWALATAETLLKMPALDANAEGTVAALLSAAGKHENALPYFLRSAAGQLAAYSHLACERISRQGLETAAHCKTGEQTDLAKVRLLTTLSVSRLSTKGFSDPMVGDSFGEAAALAQRWQMNALLPAMFYGIWVARSSRLGFRDSLELCQRIRDAESKLPGLKVNGLIATGVSLLHLGRLTEAYDDLNLAVAASLDRGEEGSGPFSFQIDDRVIAHCQMARALCLLGKFGAGRQFARQGLQIARGLAGPQAKAYALAMGASVFALTEDFEMCRAYAGEAISTATENGFFQEEIWSTVIDSYAAVCLHSDRQQLEKCRLACEKYYGAGCTVAATELNAMLVKAFLLCGDVAFARQTVENALTLSERLGEEHFLPELLRLKAECLARSNAAGAGALLREAVTLARKQSAARWELGALLTLKKLSLITGQHSEFPAAELPQCLFRFEGETSPLLETARTDSAMAAPAVG